VSFLVRACRWWTPVAFWRSPALEKTWTEGGEENRREKEEWGSPSVSNWTGVVCREAAGLQVFCQEICRLEEVFVREKERR
jgi:hypothetical protein